MRGIGDNGGPPLEPEIDPNESWRHWCWKRAVKRAWKTPGREIALRRLARAEALGISYRAYTLEILERGVYLWNARSLHRHAAALTLMAGAGRCRDW